MKKGGRAVPIKDLINDETKQNIVQASTDIASTLNGYIKNVCDIGLDMVIDSNEQVWFLEANFRPIRNTSGRRERKVFEYAYAQCMKVQGVINPITIAEDQPLASPSSFWDDDHEWEQKERKDVFGHDEFCGNIYAPMNTKTVLWENLLQLQVSGTVSVYHGGGSSVMEVWMNEEHLFSVTEGQTRSVTVPHLQKLEVFCTQGKQACTGKYCLSIHYPLT